MSFLINQKRNDLRFALRDWRGQHPPEWGSASPEYAYSIRQVKNERDHIELVSPNPNINPVIIEEGKILKSEGVVTHNIKRFANYHNHYGGFPVDVTNYIENGMDYNKYLVDWRETTFYLWADGDSMTGDCIDKGDLLVVDNMPDAYPDSIHVFVVDRNYTLKRVIKREGFSELVSSNPDIPPIRIREGEELKRWGLLTAVIKKMI